MRRPDSQTMFLGASVVLAVSVILYVSVFDRSSLAPLSTRHAATHAAEPTAVAIRDNPFDGRQALTYLKQLCAIGPRPSGTTAMKQQQDLLIEHFSKLGATVSRQTVEIRHPENGSAVPITNLIVEWHPNRARRRLVCAHYDTRPFPDRDRNRPHGRFVGANDGASGASLMMELGKHMAGLPGPVGVDFVLFDGEEFVFDDDRDRDYYFIGSTFFARVYANTPPAHRYEAGLLLDMIADANLDLYHERNSLKFAPTVVVQVWNIAKRLGIEEFRPRLRHEVRDDHLPLNEIARIPTCDLIDFDYPRPGARQSYWHTEDDLPDKCSAASLSKVGWVVWEWLKLP